MNRKTIYLCIGTVILITAYFCFLSYEHNPDRVFARFSQQLREEKFEEIYDESDSSVQQNVTKQEFVQRMKEVVANLKEIDSSLNFQRDEYLEDALGHPYKGTLRATPILSNEKYGVNLIIYWSSKGVLPRFTDITISSMNPISNKYAIQGVSYKNITYEERSGKRVVIYHY